MAKLALTMLAAAAMAAPAFASICDVMDPYLPSMCPCTDTSAYGASIDCEIDFLYLDEIDFQVAFEPCATPAHASISVSDADFGEINHHSRVFVSVCRWGLAPFPRAPRRAAPRHAP